MTTYRRDYKVIYNAKGENLGKVLYEFDPILIFDKDMYTY